MVKTSHELTFAQLKRIAQANGFDAVKVGRGKYLSYAVTNYGEVMMETVSSTPSRTYQLWRGMA
jgi:hypothetical protein